MFVIGLLIVIAAIIILPFTGSSTNVSSGGCSSCGSCSGCNNCSSCSSCSSCSGCSR